MTERARDPQAVAVVFALAGHRTARAGKLGKKPAVRKRHAWGPFADSA